MGAKDKETPAEIAPTIPRPTIERGHELQHIEGRRSGWWQDLLILAQVPNAS